MSAAPDATTFPAAELDRRFYAFAVDRLIAWTVDLVAAVVIWNLLVAEGSTALGIVLIVLTVLLVGGIFSLVQGLRGLTPGKAALGLRVVGLGTGAPIGAGPGLLRGLVLGAGALPTFGFGVATLAWTAVMDRDRLRRGWHDHVAGSIVVDVRPAPEEDFEEAPAPRHIVNLTAMRLVPAPAAAPVATPSRAPRTPPTGTAIPGAEPAPAPARAPVPEPPRPVVPTPEADVPPPTPPTPPSGPMAPAPEAFESTAIRTQTAEVRTDRAIWRVSFDTGESFVVEGLALVGRRPESRPGEPVRHLVPLRSEDMSVSKTHAQFQVAADGVLVVTDRGSTNGSVLVRQGAPRELPAGKATTLLDGDVVRFGDRQMTVTRER